MRAASPTKWPVGQPYHRNGSRENPDYFPRPPFGALAPLVARSALASPSLAWPLVRSARRLLGAELSQALRSLVAQPLARSSLSRAQAPRDRCPWARERTSFSNIDL